MASRVESGRTVDDDPKLPCSPTVLFVMPLAEQRGGAEVMALQLMRGARDHGITLVIVFLEDGPMVQEARALGLTAYVIDAGRLRNPFRYARAVLSLHKLIKRVGADAVLGWMSKAHLYSGPASILAGIPSTWLQAGIPSRRSLLDRAATGCPSAGVIVLSRRAVRAQNTLWPRRSTLLVYPGADLERFDRQAFPPAIELRRSLGLPTEGPLVGVACRLQTWKGLDCLIDAIKVVRRSHPAVHLVVVGGEHRLEPNHLSELTDHVRSADLTSSVTFVGHQVDVPKWISAMSVFCLPSDETESFGIVVVEAMQLGKPVIASLEGGPSEIITDGLNGLLVPSGDCVALAGAIDRVISDPILGASLASAGQVRAQDFSSTAFTANMARSLRELLEWPE